ncbi:MAG: iron ABC transporter permease [Myxococcota bacterium]|nr:iron ABC transporter permease [Myxococcota bacterium]
MKHLTPTRFALTLSLLAAFLFVVVVFSLGMGPSAIEPGEVFRALFAPVSPDPVVDIVRGIRLPRVVLAALVGASLACAGVIFQALLRNPLADPFILGVSGGAALGAIAMISLGGALGLGYAAVAPAAFAGCLLTLLLLYFVAGRGSRVSPTALLLTGVVFNAFASAAIIFLASAADMLDGSRIFIWLIGNLSAARLDAAPWLAGFLLIGLSCALLSARGLNVLALGEETAEQLGVSTDGQRRILLVASSLMVGAAVSISGLIGFVGLIIPHALRLVLGPDHRLLVPASALGGAAFLVLCDTLARTLLGGRELPVGAITALLGGPVFLFLLRRGEQSWIAPGGSTR